MINFRKRVQDGSMHKDDLPADEHAEIVDAALHYDFGRSTRKLYNHKILTTEDDVSRFEEECDRKKLGENDREN